MTNKINHMDILKKGLKNNQIDISSSTMEKMLQFLHLIREWNRVFNLTSITDHHKMIVLHLLDSLAITPYLHGSRILDVGSGAGLPGIPLALACPDKSFTLLDSNNKKTRFLTQAILELKLTNVEAQHTRVEHFNPPQKFDSIVSRAFASLNVMLETTEHLIAKHGQFLAMKGTYPEVELQDLPQGFKVLAVHKLEIKDLNAARHVVCMEKIH